MNQKFSLSPLQRFFNLLKVDKQDIISIYVYAVFNGLISLSLPIGIQAIINLISGGQISTSWILLVALVILGIALMGVMQIMQLTITENLQQKIFTRSAFEFAYRIPRMKSESVDNFYMPELVNRFFDTLSVQKGLSKLLLDFSSASLQIVFGLILLSIYHPFFILFSLLLVIIVYLIFRFTAPKGLRTSLEESKRKYEVAHWLEELARTMETFKLAGETALPLEKTDVVVEGYLGSRKEHFKSLLTQYINLVGFKVIIAAGLLIIGGLLVINQQMNIGQFVASEIIIILILASVEKLILSMETIYDVLSAIEKIGNVTDIPLEKDDNSKMKFEGNNSIAIQLNDLSYRFPDATEDLIKNIHLNISAGEKICLSGFDGSGKSLLLQLVSGLYENHTGSISYNNIPLGNWNKESLRSNIGDNLMKEDIFHGTLKENITMGRVQITMEEIAQISSAVGLSPFVESLHEGYNTTLIPQGRNLPKSIRIKIILARSLSGNPRLLLLDDNFNQLNDQDKTQFIKYLMKQDFTVIAISNDPEVAKKFDKVIVLDNGKLIAASLHDELQKESWYSQIFQKTNRNA